MFACRCACAVTRARRGFADDGVISLTLFLHDMISLDAYSFG